MGKKHYVSTEIKQQILGRINKDGVSVAQAANDHGISSKTIYNWLSKKSDSVVSRIEYNKVLRQNAQLKHIVGDLTIKMSTEAKKGSSWMI